MIGAQPKTVQSNAPTCRFKPFCSSTLLLAFFMMFSPGLAHGENTAYEEIYLTARVQGVGAFDLNALYVYDSGQLLLPVADIFRFLHLKTEISTHADTISGFIVDESNRYLIDHPNKQIFANGETYTVQNKDLIKTETGLFLDHLLFGQIFGLHCDFNFRALSLEIKPDFEVPVIREMRLVQFRKNVQQLRGEVEVDTALNREYHLFRFGMVDWMFSSTQNTAQPNDTRLRLAAGAELAGGETNLILNYSTRYGIDNQYQQYYWRWADNKPKAIRQVRVGTINPSYIASVYDPVVGFSVTNAPTTYRRAFGEYTISDYTEPGWTVELYVNKVIVDYQTADAMGFYSFDVPLVYGSSEVMLKFYGPYGEERVEEQFINIPFNFLPPGEVEYRVSSGLVADGENSRFGRAEVKYGLNRFVTVGGGMEYLSAVATGSKIPFLTASVTPFRNFLVTGEYAHGVRSNALLNYRLSSGATFELDYTRYVPGQKAIRFDYREQRKAALSVPMRFSFLNGHSRWSFQQNVYEHSTYNTANVTISAFRGRHNANLSAYANWLKNGDPVVYGNLGFGFRTDRGFTLRPQGQFDITRGEITSVKAELEKRIFRSGYVSVSGEENFRSDYWSVALSFRWDLPFAQTNLSARVSSNDFSSTVGGSGSFAFGGGNGYVYKDNRPATGRGGVTITPFVDINHNGVRDDGEPLASGLDVRMSGGRILSNRNDSIIRIVGLEPYTSYLLTLNDHGLEQISWQLKHKNIRVEIDPNQFKKIDIPVLPMGEVNGWVYIEDEKGTRGLGRIVINFFTDDGVLVASTMTESDGGFTFLGLPPGKYNAQVDSAQLSGLKMTSTPLKMDFELEPMYDGDIVYDLRLIIRSLPNGVEAHPATSF
jgi:hypothetical protein